MTRCRKAAGYVRTGLAICGGLYITVLAVAFWLTAPRTARSGCNPPYDVEDCCECDEVKIELEQNTLCLGASATGVVHWTYRGEIGVVPPRHISVSPTSRLLLSDVVHHPSERCTDTNIISTFTITAVGFSSALNDAEVIAWTRECFNTNPVSVIGVDLDLDSDHTHDYDGWPTGGEPTVFEDAIEDGSGAATNYPGLKFIVVNDFHETAAGTGVPGYADFEMTSPYAPADSSVFVELQLALAPALMAMTGATVEFTYHASDPSGITTTNQDGVVIYNLPTTTNSHLRLWTQKQSTDRNTNSVPSGHFIASGEPYSAADLGFSATATKRIFFIEAVSNVAELAKCAIRVAVAYEDDLVCDDTVICTPIRVDVDVDSNNDDGFAVPERNLAEDHYEDLTNGYFAVGKVIEVNSEEETSDEQFVPIVFEIPEPIDIDQADVRLEYQAADTAAGRLGIWKRVAGRTAADYVAPSNYTATAFGFSADQRIVTNYIQAITVSAAPGDARVVFSVDPDGAATSVPGYIAVDAVRVTIIKVDLDVDLNGDGNFAEDDPDETTPGLFVCVNDDDDGAPTGTDNGNDQIDTAADKNDMKILKLRQLQPPSLTSGTVTLSVDDKSKLRIFDNSDTARIGPAPGPDADSYDVPLSDITGGDLDYLVEGVDPGEVVVSLVYKDSSGTEICRDEVVVTIIKPDLDIYRMDGSTKVDEDYDHTEGSITRVLNPNDGETAGTGQANGISLKLEPSIEPTGLSLTYKLRLNDIHTVANDKGLVRVYRSSVTTGPVLDNTTAGGASEVTLNESDFTDDFWMEFEGGGIMEFELAAFSGSTEICKDAVRACAIPCTPKTGRILFVNPGTSAGSSLNDYTDDSADTIAAALTADSDNMNVVVSSTTYDESGLSVDTAVALGGLGIRWIDNPNTDFKDLVAWTPQFSLLPLVQPSSAAQIVEVKDDDVRVGGFLFKDGLGRGGGVNAEKLDDLAVCCIKFQDCFGSEGGGLYFGADIIDSGSGQNLTVVDCAFNGNTAYEAGGGLALRKGEDITISRTLFENNEVGGADENVIYRGGAIFVFKGDGDLVLKKCFLQGNKVDDQFAGGDNGMTIVEYAGALKDGLAGRPLQKIVTIDLLDVGSYGGAISAWEGSPDLQLEDNYFFGNRCLSSKRRARGGAVSIRDISNTSILTKCRFGKDVITGNDASGSTRASGGGMDLFKASAQINECSFVENSVASAGPANLPDEGDDTLNHRPDSIDYGGAIAMHHGRWPLASILTISDCEFLKNRAWTCGGAIGITGESEAITGEGSAGLDASRHVVTIGGSSTFIENESGFHGGAIGCVGFCSELTIDGVVFDGNKVTVLDSVDADGAAIAYQVANTATIKNSTFKNNTAADSAACKHGGLSLAYYKSCTFENNKSLGTDPPRTGFGGAIRVSSLGKVVIEENTKFSQNEAGDGGAISAQNAKVVVKGPGSISSNTARRSGGAFHLLVRTSGFGPIDAAVAGGFSPYFRVFGTSSATYSLSSNDAVDLGGLGQCETGSTVGANVVPRFSPSAVPGVPVSVTLTPIQIVASVKLERCLLKANTGTGLYNAGPINEKIAGLNVQTHADHTIATTLKNCTIDSHDGIAVLVHSSSSESDNALLTLSDSTCSDNKVAVFLQHADLDMDDVTFTTTLPVTTFVGVGGDVGLSYDQEVRIDGCSFTAAGSTTGILVSHPLGTGVNQSGHSTDVRVRGSSFLNMQATPPAPGKGAILVSPVPANSVDASNAGLGSGNYWDDPGGPNDPASRNPAGSYVSDHVDFSGYLLSVP